MRSSAATPIEATAYPGGDSWVLNGVKWHVTSFNTADCCFFQAKRTDYPERPRGPIGGDHLLFLVDLPSPGVSVVRTPAYRAVQVFGGRGYMRENVAERFFRELRVERIWEGTSEVQRVIIARQLTTRGVSALA